MFWRHSSRFLFLCLLFLPVVAAAQGKAIKVVKYDARQFEIAYEQGKQVVYLVGSVVFETENGFIYCDSAVLRPGEQVRLKGRVRIDDPDYRLQADSVTYQLSLGEASAWGESVRLWSFKDSLYAVGTHAFLKKEQQYFFMDDRPTLFLRYPDSANMVQIVANQIEYDGTSGLAQAEGNTVITSQDIATSSGCAVMHIKENGLDLFDKPTLTRERSTLSGELISITYADRVLKQLDVYDSAYGSFKEPVDSTKGWYDEAILRGKFITLRFTDGKLDSVVCSGSAYSWYYPAKKNESTQYQNSVSGDTIYFDINDNVLQRVTVVGESIGQYVGTSIKKAEGDSVAIPVADTVNYQGRTINYAVKDSLITLSRQAAVTSGTMSLEAEKVLLDTKTNRVEAFSAAVDSGITTTTSRGELHLQPNTIPVTLKDNGEVLYGDYLEYSLKTEKGRILQSKSSYQQGFYYGNRLYREQRRIFYVDDGRYTTCDADEPHFHFYSAHMKLIENDKLIAKPVVFYLDRLPILALPFYVFPLKRGRHSGILPLEFGQFQEEKRYVRNVGYYWAASQYWDWQGSFDYFELQRTINLNSRINFAKRYVLNGYISGTSSFVSSYDETAAEETKSRRWALVGAYNHTFTPDFEVRSYGQFQSDASYYKDYSSNLVERLNRSVKSQASFVKRFGTQTSLSGSFSHTDNLDLRSRIDVLPDMTLSLPTIKPFGSGSATAEGGTERHWYQETSFRYSPHLVNSSSRTSVIDTISGTDTTFNRRRIAYTRVDHNPSLTLPTLTLLRYFTFTPSFRYNESWYKIYSTNVSDSLSAQQDVDYTKTYRTYTYSGSVAMNTKVYGTLTPHLFGVEAVRHVFAPTISYSFVPEIDRNGFISSYAGGTSGITRKGSIVGVGLNQLFQAKVGEGELARAYDVLSVNSNFSYNLEDKKRPISDMTTSFYTSTIRRVNLSGSATHTFYKPNSDDFKITHPRLTNFSVNLSTQLHGSRFLFDDPAGSQPVSKPAADSAARAGSPYPTQTRTSGWNMSIQYGYSESHSNGAIFKTSSFFAYTLNFNLTPSTSVSYQQRYSFLDDRTTSSSVSIQKNLHCWTGSLYWVPSGSNRGFGFRLFVTAMPEIKIDDQYNNFLDGIQHR